jgi:thiamine-monophosphate kinase
MSMTKKSLFNGFNSISKLGEFGLIDQVAKLFGTTFNSNVTGIGDDCAVLPFAGNNSMLVTTDMLIEDRHFKRDRITPRDLGYKSLAVNLSDISAMGGKPVYAFLSIGLADDISLEWLDQFFKGAHELSEEHEVKILGGDTTKSSGPMFISFTVLGIAETDMILMRSDAKAGDVVVLLGTVGESGAGLNVLMNTNDAENEQYKKLISAHNRPQIYVEEAQFLAKFPAVHAMIDLSDGISSDAGHIAQKSEVKIQIDIEKLPLSDQLKNVCNEFSWSPVELALTAGEDYGLLFTVDAGSIDDMTDSFKKEFGYRLNIIGKVLEGSPDVTYVRRGKPFVLQKHGFDHFKS